MPILFLGTVLHGVAPLPVKLDDNVPHFSTELCHANEPNPNPVIHIYVDTDTGISCICLTTAVNLMLDYPHTMRRIYQYTKNSHTPILLAGFVSEDTDHKPLLNYPAPYTSKQPTILSKTILLMSFYQLNLSEYCCHH